jgi:hypothetical protein
LHATEHGGRKVRLKLLAPDPFDQVPTGRPQGRIGGESVNKYIGVDGNGFTVTVHESRVTSVQKRMEPRRSLLGCVGRCDRRALTKDNHQLRELLREVRVA